MHTRGFRLMNTLTSDSGWPNGARVALSIVVNVEEGAEMNIRDGDARPEPVDELSASPRHPMRVHGNESNYLYGINAGAARIFRLLGERSLPATVTAAALALERAPRVLETILASGYEVACHGYRWVHQFRMNPDEERAFIRQARELTHSLTGTRPLGWLSRYLHTEHTRRLLIEEGFFYHMDDYSGDLPYWAEEDVQGSRKRILMLPYAIDTNDMKLWTSPSLTPTNWAGYVIDSMDWLVREARVCGPRMLSVGLHLRIIGRPGRIGALEKVLDHAAALMASGTLWVASRIDIARAFATMESPNTSS